MSLDLDYVALRRSIEELAAQLTDASSYKRLGVQPVPEGMVISDHLPVPTVESQVVALRSAAEHFRNIYQKQGIGFECDVEMEVVGGPFLFLGRWIDLRAKETYQKNPRDIP